MLLPTDKTYLSAYLKRKSFQSQPEIKSFRR